jgi:hypothetical protein
MRKLPLVTPRAQVDIRGVYGQSVLDLYEQMSRLLMHETGSQTVGDIFAEPQVNPVRGEISWYTGAVGPIVPVAQLQAEAKAALWQQVEQLREQIKTIGERYIAGGGPTAGTRADTFRAMLTVTDPSRCLFSVGGRPVLSEWGCSLVAGENRSVDLWTNGAARSSPPTPSGSGSSTPAAAFVLPVPSTPTPPHETAPVPPSPGAEEELDDARLAEAAGRVDLPKSKVDAPVRRVTSAAPLPAPSATSSFSRERTARSTGGGAWHNGRNGRASLWDLLKYLFLLLLGLLLVGLLVRACDVDHVTVGALNGNEEKQLRAEIAALREQATQIAAHCTSPGTTP